MGIFSFGKNKKPDPSKREPGFGTVNISPYLFDQDEKEDFFSEVKRLVLPYLTEEEEEAIVEWFKEDRKTFRALVPEDIFNDCEDISEEAKTFYMHLAMPWYNFNNICCHRWASSACCGGMKMSEHIHRNLSDNEKTEDDRKDYFILEHMDYVHEQESERSIALRRSSLEYEAGEF